MLFFYSLIWGLYDQVTPKHATCFFSPCTFDVWNEFFVIFKILSGCNGTRTHNPLLRKTILNHLAKPFRSVWLNGWLLLYELRGCGFESRCSHLNFRFRACFEKGVLSHSGNYRMWIHSEMRTWLDKNIQFSRYCL